MALPANAILILTQYTTTPEKINNSFRASKFFISITVKWSEIYGIMSLLRHSILRQSLLQQSLLWLLILRQWPIIFAILVLLTIQFAVRDCLFNLKEEAWFLSRSRKFFSYATLLFLKLFSVAQQNVFYKTWKENIISCRSNKNAFCD